MLKSYLQPIMKIPLSLFDRTSSYLAQQLPMTCRLQLMSRYTDMTFESKVKVNIITICLLA